MGGTPKTALHRFLLALQLTRLGQPDPERETEKFLTLMLGYFTCTSFLRKLLMGETPKTALSRFSAQNPLYPVFLVLISPCLVFALLANTSILQRANPLAYEDFFQNVKSQPFVAQFGFIPIP